MSTPNDHKATAEKAHIEHGELINRREVMACQIAAAERGEDAWPSQANRATADMLVKADFVLVRRYAGVINADDYPRDGIRR